MFPDASPMSVKLLESVSKNMSGKTFHHHSHILYDIRSKLGTGPKTYTEIGSFNGGSASMMLMHPYETTVVCIDPMVAEHAQHDTFLANIRKFNVFNRPFTHHKRFSYDIGLIETLRSQNFKTDILFIDGGHDFTDVVTDFSLFLEFLNPLGYIVFDDYNDYKHSPEVKPAVDQIIQQLPHNSFKVYKDFENPHNAFCSYPLKFSNECVFEMLPQNSVLDPNPVIVMATYFRPDGSSKNSLTKTLESVLAQSCAKWTLIIVSDAYEPADELLTIVNSFREKTSNSIILLQNNICERDHIKGDARQLWRVAGAISMNRALLYARQNGFQYYFHLDDDDAWSPDHLTTIMATYEEFPTCVFVNTQSTYRGGKLPTTADIDVFPNNRIPRGCDTVHSSYSFKLDIIPYYYVTALSKGRMPTPTDAFMLSSIGKFIEQSDHTAIYVPKLTCFKDQR